MTAARRAFLLGRLLPANVIRRHRQRARTSLELLGRVRAKGTARSDPTSSAVARNDGRSLREAGFRCAVPRGTDAGVAPAAAAPEARVAGVVAAPLRSEPTLKGHVAAASPPETPREEPALPEDGMTRYPSLQSSQGLLRGLTYLGTVTFACSGSVTAGLAHMDILGCCVVGAITALGGGTVRDLLLGTGPVFWMRETEYAWIAGGVAALTFFGWTVVAEGRHDDASTVLLLRGMDAVGVGAVCLIGAQSAVRAGASAAIAIACGTISATFGGVIRDVLCGKPPRILHSESEVYATTAMAGSSTYVLLRHLGCSPYVKIWGGFFAAVATRYIAWRWDWRLPTWGRSDDPLGPDASFLSSPPSPGVSGGGAERRRD